MVYKMFEEKNVKTSFLLNNLVICDRILEEHFFMPLAKAVFQANIDRIR